MNLIRFNNEMPVMRSFFDNDLFDSFLSRSLMDEPTFSNKSLVPPVNFIENDNEVIIEMAAPGLKKENFKVNYENATLTISYEEENKKSDDSRIREEWNYTNFSRSFRIGKNMNPEKIEANFVDGVLTMKIAKREQDPALKARTIEIA